MTECPACGCILRLGRLFCTECGCYLHADSPLTTEPLPKDDLPGSAEDAWLRGIDRYEDAEVPETATKLRVSAVKGDHEELFSLPIEEICMGRRDPSHGAYPHLDLTPYGGRKRGVSRHHARIYQVGKHLFVEDLDSANGTLLNDRRITPYLPYPLRGGDRLQLGKLQLVVELH